MLETIKVFKSSTIIEPSSSNKENILELTASLELGKDIEVMVGNQAVNSFENQLRFLSSKVDMIYEDIAKLKSSQMDTEVKVFR